MNINQITNKIDKFVQVTMNNQPNARAKVVGVTDKKVYVQIMNGNKYNRNAEGEIVRTLVNADRIKFYAKAE